MPRIDRESAEDAQAVADGFLGDQMVKKTLLTFLSDAIIFANGLNPDNWNLNLDIHGQFIRLNVGQEYCIEIFRDYSLVLALKHVLKADLGDRGLRLREGVF
jgi:hypothetical protein